MAAARDATPGSNLETRTGPAPCAASNSFNLRPGPWQFSRQHEMHTFLCGATGDTSSIAMVRGHLAQALQDAALA